MRLKNDSEKWDRLKSWKGKYKKFHVRIGEGSNDPLKYSSDYYYFTVHREEDDIRHNSLWLENKYDSLEQAEQAAVMWIDEKLKSIKLKKKG